MYFLLIGMDGIDADALARRQAVRAEHLELAQQFKAAGKIVMAAARLHEDGSMAGSVIIYSADSRDQLDRWLIDEPYITGDVWRDISIEEVKVPPFML
jgi:uncharacterized protein YciI